MGFSLQNQNRSPARSSLSRVENNQVGLIVRVRVFVAERSLVRNWNLGVGCLEGDSNFHLPIQLFVAHKATTTSSF